MLKDITLGQFFPGNTPIHRLDPRTKLLCVILYIVALFNAKGPLTYGIMIVVLAVCILLSKVEWKALTRGLKPVYIIVAFTAIMNMFFTTGTPVADVWLLRHITWQGIISAVQMVLRIVMLIMGTFLMTYTTSPIALTDGLESRCLRVECPPRLLECIPADSRDGLLGVLAGDPRPRYQEDPQRVYGMGFAGQNVRFTVDGETLTVHSIDPLEK